jgi:hypothetical protein
VTLCIAYQGSDFAALCTDSFRLTAEADVPVFAGPSPEPKVLWASFRRIAYAISGVVPGRAGTIRSLPQDALEAAQTLAKWLEASNPDLAHVLTIGSPMGEIPTAHRIVIGSNPSVTTAAPGEVIFGGAFAAMARELRMERSYGVMDTEAAVRMLVGLGSLLILEADEVARQAGNGSLPTISWPLQVATITKSTSSEATFSDVSIGVSA